MMLWVIFLMLLLLSESIKKYMTIESIESKEKENILKLTINVNVINTLSTYDNIKLFNLEPNTVRYLHSNYATDEVPFSEINDRDSISLNMRMRTTFPSGRIKISTVRNLKIKNNYAQINFGNIALSVKYVPCQKDNCVEVLECQMEYYKPTEETRYIARSIKMTIDNYEIYHIENVDLTSQSLAIPISSTFLERNVNIDGHVFKVLQMQNTLIYEEKIRYSMMPFQEREIQQNEFIINIIYYTKTDSSQDKSISVVTVCFADSNILDTCNVGILFKRISTNFEHNKPTKIYINHSNDYDLYGEILLRSEINGKLSSKTTYIRFSVSTENFNKLSRFEVCKNGHCFLFMKRIKIVSDLSVKSNGVIFNLGFETCEYTSGNYCREKNQLNLLTLRQNTDENFNFIVFNKVYFPIMYSKHDSKITFEKSKIQIAENKRIYIKYAVSSN